MRLTRKRLKEAHEEEYEKIRLLVELELYPEVIRDYEGSVSREENLLRGALEATLRSC